VSGARRIEATVAGLDGAAGQRLFSQFQEVGSLLRAWHGKILSTL